MKLNLFKLFVVLVWPLATASAADVNTKFGKPTKEEMQMTVYEAEPDAEAVVLCRLTDVEYTIQTTSFLVDYHERWRIKVLKPGGTRFAKVVVPYKKMPEMNEKPPLCVISSFVPAMLPTLNSPLLYENTLWLVVPTMFT